jgi:folate-binding protein YgfZ
MRERDGWLVPAHYGNTQNEYEAVRRAGAGLFDLSSRGRVELKGSDAIQFLNGMITNDVAKLENGTWMHAAFPNVQGRLLASARIARIGDTFVLDTEAATAERMYQALERFTLAGDFRVRDLSHESVMLSIQGVGASKVIAEVLGEELDASQVATASIGGAQVMLWRATHTAEDGFDVITAVGDAAAVWNSFTAAGARASGYDALEILRIEAGIARYGVDANDSNVVLEVVDEDAAVSYTKGCYIGQEIIARIHWRGHVAKKLTGLVVESGKPAAHDARIKSRDEEREVGRITSTVYSPELQKQIALGIVRYDHLTAGTEVRIFAGDELLSTARVTDVPFVKGSWHGPGSSSSAEARGQ